MLPEADPHGEGEVVTAAAPAWLGECQWLRQVHHRPTRPGHRARVCAVAITSDGRMVLSSGGGRVFAWDKGSGECLMASSGHSVSVAGENHALIGGVARL